MLIWASFSGTERSRAAFKFQIENPVLLLPRKQGFAVPVPRSIRGRNLDNLSNRAIEIMTFFEHGMTCRVPDGQHTDRVEISASKWLGITGRLPAAVFVLPQLGVTPMSLQCIKAFKATHPDFQLVKSARKASRPLSST
jgi:hypothetical protein